MGLEWGRVEQANERENPSVLPSYWAFLGVIVTGPVLVSNTVTGTIYGENPHCKA
jgi:hypothetical protein